ncbi:NAD-dependent succinate-semialdehyde dehydrogenase [Ramlibacter sp.]|uniref:NAD-dependent succinate-semialdehyde dehydrogenase n=1 Tax=Ramlibacter sp. TaxID=1917967 RepID=UPI0017B83A67|nr:NAD-dependent succinate-semialdehyde dehydrogenase [Ramlibacter sp.]MBA2676184.1 NAD-dependent succinate-semialdehyde dehydrogenase [Ramlibacter sp.]
MAYPELALFLDGGRRQGQGRLLRVHNPATGERIADFAGATPQEVEGAAASAYDAFKHWRDTPAYDREAILRRAANAVRAQADHIAAVIVMENGKPLAEAKGEVGATADTIDFYAGEARRIYGRTIPARTAGGRMSTLREPVGVVAAFTPWNFPAINFIRKVAPALAAGCAVVAKPAEETPATALLLAQCFADAGLPPGALSIVYGVPADISSQLIAAPQVRKITFTGSTAVGRELAAKAGALLKRSTMELGGHAPVIVCADANAESAADKASAAKFRNAGQTCNSASRFYVHRSLYERFVQRFAENAVKVVVGDGADAATTMGPLSNPRRIEALKSLVADALARGARLAAGGAPLERPGWFFQPTVLADVPADAQILAIEPFGPVAPIVPFDSIEEAIQLANSTPFGLASYAIGDHAPTIRLLTTRIEAGIVGVNTFVASLPETPFGGVGHSGWGHEGGPEGLEPYLHTRFINEL